MSLEKAIKHGKEKRKPYYKSEAFDASCRPHGGCGWCRGNRLRYKEIEKLNFRDEMEWAFEYFDYKAYVSDYLIRGPRIYK